MAYLKTGKVKENTRTPGLQEVKRKLRYLSMSDKERREYDAHLDNIMVQNDVLDTAREEGLAEGLEKGLAEGREKGLAEGLEKGLAEGREKGLAEGREKGLAEGQRKERIAIARNMLAAGIGIDLVTSMTGITSDELNDYEGNI